MAPLICEIPYPSTDDLEADVRSGQILSFAYATPRGAVNAVLQYCYHATHMRKHSADDADILKSIAQAEAMHAQIIGAAMEKLGVNPLYIQYPNSKRYYTAAMVSQSTKPQKMLMDDIVAEMNSITEFRKMLFVLKNEQVEALVERLIMDEQLHIETLKNMLRHYTADQNV